MAEVIALAELAVVDVEPTAVALGGLQLANPSFSFSSGGEPLLAGAALAA